MTPADGVRVTSPVPRDVWLDSMAADPNALATQTPGWLGAILETQPYRDVSRWYQWRNGRQLILPMVRRCPPSADRDEELAWPTDWGIGGVVAPGGPVGVAEAAVVFKDLGRRAEGGAYLRPAPSVDAVWRSAAPASARLNPRITHILDLAGGFDTVWRERFSGNVRRGIRKAERSGLTVARGNTLTLMDDFDHLYRLSVDRWANQAGADLQQARAQAELKDPRRKFTAVARNLGDNCVIWMAYRDNAPVAGIITLWRGPHAKYWRGAMDKPVATATCAPTYLQFLAVREACTRGCRFYHMGDSRPGDSVSRFKETLGARPHHTAGYWIAPAG